MEQYITQEELSNILKVSQITLKRWRDKGMPFHKLGYKCVRYSYCEVMEWLRNR